MTRRERTNQRSLDFSNWIRKNLKDSFNGLITQDIDWIFVNYCTGYFIIIEEKTHRYIASQYTSPAQTVIFKMLDEMLKLATTENNKLKISKNPATQVPYQYKGAFILEFVNGTDPENSERIYLNGQEIFKTELITLMNLEKDSDTLLSKYQSDWIEKNLTKQRNNLTGNCNKQWKK